MVLTILVLSSRPYATTVDLLSQHWHLRPPSQAHNHNYNHKHAHNHCTHQAQKHGQMCRFELLGTLVLLLYDLADRFGKRAARERYELGPNYPEKQLADDPFLHAARPTQNAP